MQLPDIGGILNGQNPLLVILIIGGIILFYIRSRNKHK